MNNFNNYNFKDFINKSLKELNFYTPTPVQNLVIPKALKGNNLMVESCTGSGKTHSFLLPIFQNLNPSINECFCVIISPTRELAEQLYNNALFIANHSTNNIRVCKVVGGTNRDEDIQKFSNLTPHIVIGTIGRIHDLVFKENILKIHTAKMVVIDEADMIFEEKELPEVDHIMGKIINDPQFMIFSATISKGLRSFLNHYFQNIETICIEEKNLTTSNITHLMLQCKAKAKENVLLDLMKVINPYLSIIFVNTKESVDKLSQFLAEQGYHVGKLHGNMNDRERSSMLKRINNLEYKYIVASDIAARGIDIDGVSHVINFDLPNDIEFYIHRCGRTGRANQTGIAISLYSYDDDRYVNLLREKGLIVKFVKLSNNELIQTKLEHKSNHSFVRDIESSVHQKVKMPKKVKPGYKKKRNELIQKEIKKQKRAHIEEIYKAKARKEHK